MTRSWPTVAVDEPLMCSQGGIPFNKAHLDARDAEIERLREQLGHAVPAIDELTKEREEYRTRWLGSVTPEEGARLRTEIERLRAALREIADLDDVRCDEAPMIARRALAFDDEQSSPTRIDSMEQGGISDRLSNFDEWGDRIRDKS